MWIHVVPHCWFLTGLAAGLTKGGRIASRAALLAGGSRWTVEVARGAGKAIASRNLEKWRCTQQKMMIYIDIIDLLRTVKVDQFNRIVSNLIGTPLDQEVK